MKVVAFLGVVSANVKPHSIPREQFGSDENVNLYQASSTVQKLQEPSAGALQAELDRLKNLMAEHPELTEQFQDQNIMGQVEALGSSVMQKVQDVHTQAAEHKPRDHSIAQVMEELNGALASGIVSDPGIPIPEAADVGTEDVSPRLEVIKPEKSHQHFDLKMPKHHGNANEDELLGGLEQLTAQFQDHNEKLDDLAGDEQFQAFQTYFKENGINTADLIDQFQNMPAAAVPGQEAVMSAEGVTKPTRSKAAVKPHKQDESYASTIAGYMPDVTSMLGEADVVEEIPASSSIHYSKLAACKACVSAHQDNASRCRVETHEATERHQEYYSHALSDSDKISRVKCSDQFDNMNLFDEKSAVETETRRSNDAADSKAGTPVMPKD